MVGRTGRRWPDVLQIQGDLPCRPVFVCCSEPQVGELACPAVLTVRPKNAASVDVDDPLHRFHRPEWIILSPGLQRGPPLLASLTSAPIIDYVSHRRKGSTANSASEPAPADLTWLHGPLPTSRCGTSGAWQEPAGPIFQAKSYLLHSRSACSSQISLPRALLTDEPLTKCDLGHIGQYFSYRDQAAVRQERQDDLDRIGRPDIPTDENDRHDACLA